jgi:hypothetical protein
MAQRALSPKPGSELRARLRDAAKLDRRPVQQVVTPAMELLLDMTQASRKSIYSLGETASADERAFLARFLGRQVLRAHHTIIENRHLDGNRGALANSGSNAVPVTEEDVENEAARLCKSL